MSTEPLQQEGYDFMATAFEVYNELGHGFTEDIYQEALERELAAHNIPFLPQAEIAITYKGQPLRKKLRPDLLVSKHIVVELKAASSLTSEHEAQLLIISKLPVIRSGILLILAVPKNSSGSDSPVLKY